MIDSWQLTIKSNDLTFMIALTLKKNLCSPMSKWSDDSTSRKTKDRRQHTLVTFAILALEKGL